MQSEISPSYKLALCTLIYLYFINDNNNPDFKILAQILGFEYRHYKNAEHSKRNKRSKFNLSVLQSEFRTKFYRVECAQGSLHLFSAKWFLKARLGRNVQPRLKGQELRILFKLFNKKTN